MIHKGRLDGIRSWFGAASGWHCLLHSLDKAVLQRKAIVRKLLRQLARTGARTHIAVLFTVLSTSPGFSASGDSGPIQIAAAASLRAIWSDLTDQLPAQIDKSDLRVSFASTGLLQVQIENGAPFDLFLAADRNSPSRLEALGFTKGRSSSYASGRLILVAKQSVAKTLNEALVNLVKQRHSDNPAKLAIANPRHAPYGRASRKWLESQALWPWPKNSLLLGENTAQALQFVHSEAVDYAVLPAAFVGTVDASFNAFDLPESDYELIDHQLIIMRNAPPLADVIATWLQSPSAQVVFAAYGLERVVP